MAYHDPFADWFNSLYGSTSQYSGGQSDPFYSSVSGGMTWNEPSSLFSDLLEEDPELAYFTQLQNQSPQLTPNQRAYFQTQSGPAYNRYLGQIGSQLSQGQLPSLKFLDYLTQTPFTKRYAELPPSLRPGVGSARFKAPTRYP